MPRPIEEPPPRRPAYFWWLLANALALCFAIVSWAVCLHIFGNPENPRNYEILGKLGRLPVLTRYTVLDVPGGNAFSPRELYGKFFGIAEKDIAVGNSLLLRNYFTNFENTLLLTYIEGDYQVERSRKLGPEDFITQGFAVRAQAMVKPDDFTKAAPYPVLIEYIFPTAETGEESHFQPGNILSIKKSPNCAAVIHVTKVIKDDEPVLCLTVIPIAYGPYPTGDSGSFAIEPPARFQPGAGFPIFKADK